MVLKVGVTGGIGAGKTTVCKLFSLMGVQVYNADERAKALYNEKPEIKNWIINNFGEEVYTGGELNRQHLASIIFSDPEKLALLNSYVHPKVGDDFRLWKKQHEDKPYIVKEAALLFESGSYKELDFIITVVAPLEERVKRVVARDGSKEEAVIARINNQMPQEKKEQMSHFVVNNNGRKSLIAQVVELHGIFRGKSGLSQ